MWYCVVMRYCVVMINPLPNDRFLDWSKFKAFADDILYYITTKIISVFYRVENIVGKRENAGHQHFLLFLHCFKSFLN